MYLSDNDHEQFVEKVCPKIAEELERKLPSSPEEVQKINRVLVIGAGTMGTQIAVQCASHGRLVFLHDNIRAVVEQAPARLERLAQDLDAKGLLGSSSSRETLRRIEPTSDMAAAAQAAIVIECVPENLELKKSVFEQLGRHCRPETIYVTNTSSLVPSQLAGSCRHPERMAALHFHLPVATSNVVDLMPHPGTDPGVVAALDAFAREVGQVPIHYKREYHGYIFNSIFDPSRTSTEAGWGFTRCRSAHRDVRSDRSRYHRGDHGPLGRDTER
jgi:3-hydroxybutyryl-CoA dehydrogenase